MQKTPSSIDRLKAIEENLSDQTLLLASHGGKTSSLPLAKLKTFLGGSSGGGINVIEYDPSLHEVIADTVVSNVPPTEAVDGDFLHLLGNAKLLGKDLASGDFVQLYDNKTKFIVHANLDTVDIVGSVNGQTGVVVLDADDVGATTQTYVDTQDGLLQDQIDLKADAIAVSQSLDTKADLIGGVIPSYQLPSYVDDVLNFPDLASFPFVGEDGKIYVAEDANKTYRWSGSSYVESGGGGVALGETSSTAYRGDNGKIAYDHSLSQGNPHNTTTSDINEGTKLFFTESRVNQTVLTGLDTSTATPALATDQLLTAIGKLQSQINNIAPPTWVSAASIGLMHPNIPPTNNFIELARINGMLWIRGSFKNTGIIINESQPYILRIDDIQYKVVSRNQRTTLMANITTLNAGNTRAVIDFGNAYSICVDAATASTCIQYFVLEGALLLASTSFFHLPPTCLGELVIK